MSLLTVVSTIVVLSSSGSVAVTQTALPVQGSSCDEAVDTVWGYGTRAKFLNGKVERVRTLESPGGNTVVMTETLTCHLRGTVKDAR